MKSTLGGVLAVLCAVACGDNSKQCGEGTNDDDGDGVCEPDGTTDLICGDGTAFDPLTTECIPDPSVCGNGTVLINGQCQDPTADLDIDLIEGPEPNGFELDATSAGTIEIRPVGESFVVHGCVAPLGNNSPDLDVFELEVTGPTLLHIAADGVEGLAAGFLVLGDAPVLSDWFRLGINVATDTSKREVLLPVAGRYQLVMTDTRTLLPLTQNGEGFPAAGNPDGSTCYYVTIAQRAFPTPATIDLANGTTGEIGEDLGFFTAAFPTGFTNLFAVIDPEDVDFDGIPDLDTLGNPIDSRAATSLVLFNNDSLRQIADADASSPVTDLLFGGIATGDSPLVVLDYVWNYTIGPAQFAIEAPVQTSSLALSRTGASVDTTTNGQFFSQAGVPVFDNVNLFHFDVAAAGQIDEFDLAFDRDLQGSLIDQDGVFASPFTNLSGPIRTFRDYEGLLRHLAPGRYYFVLFAPNDAPGTALSVTSTITTLSPGAVTLGMPTAQTAFNAVQSLPFTFDTGGEPWLSLEATLVGGTSPVAVSLFDPANTTPQTPGFAFGRLDPLDVLEGGNPGVRQGDGTPLIAPFGLDGTSPLHRIFKNPVATLPAVPTALLVKVNPTAVAPTTFSLDFRARVYDDFAGPAIAAGMQKTAAAALTAGSEERYYFEAAPGTTVTITVAPDGSQPTLDLTLALLDETEAELEVIEEAGTDAAETTTFTTKLSGFTAFKVRGANGTTTGAFTVTVAVAASDYTASQTPAVFTDACLGGTLVPLVADINGFPADDEGLSSPIAAPAGFTLHGTAADFFKVSSNGFLSFAPGILDAQFQGGPLAATGEVHIAPSWDDLAEVVVCTQATATRRVIQWEGFAFEAGAPVQFQAILDADGTIEYRYGPFHFTSGDTATIGVQNEAGDTRLELGVDLPIAVPNSSIKLTPN